MNVLKTSRLFGGLVTAELHQLERTLQLRRYRAGDTIFCEGAPGDGVYIIERGTVQIVCQVAEDQKGILSRLEAGDFFGEMAVLDDQARSAAAVAETDVEVHFVPREDLLAALSGIPELAVRLVKEFSLRMRDFNAQYTKGVLQAERLTLVGRFARTIVHDFKNPLNIIGISADMAAMENASPEARQTARDRIRRQVDRMSNMISELLEFTRGGSAAVVMGRLDYGLFLRHWVTEVAPEISARRISIRLESDLPGVRVLLDPVRMGHVLHNLINNACDAMPEGGLITVRLIERENEVLTEIEDSGPGIAPEIAPRLFEAFATYGKSRGTGLGLSICRRILEDHGGGISAGRGRGGGALFTLSLPKRMEGEAAG
jgi:signal transduction histidine kinase